MPSLEIMSRRCNKAFNCPGRTPRTSPKRVRRGSRRRLAELGVIPTTILDYGCGTGSTVPFLLAIPGAERVIATDESSELLARARSETSTDRASFLGLDDPLALEG